MTNDGCRRSRHPGARALGPLPAPPGGHSPAGCVDRCEDPQQQGHRDEDGEPRPAFRRVRHDGIGVAHALTWMGSRRTTAAMVTMKAIHMALTR